MQWKIAPPMTPPMIGAMIGSHQYDVPFLVDPCARGTP
jgi:hypothetical protein